MDAQTYIMRGAWQEKLRCAERGTEAVTPAAAAKLFRKSEPRVREAAREGRIDTAFRLRFGLKEVRLYTLKSCIDYWNWPAPEALERMRQVGHLMWVEEHECTWNVLHPERLVTLEAAAD